jgi:hypothetical protein
MSDTDKYDALTGPELGEELKRRELPISGRVDELRDRLREDDARKAAESNANVPDPGSEGEETEAGEVDVPEPREPLRIQPYGVKLTEEQARVLNAGEARVLHFTKHVNKVTAIKYAAGDQVMALGSPESTHVRVLPYGIEIELTRDENEED